MIKNAFLLFSTFVDDMSTLYSLIFEVSLLTFYVYFFVGLIYEKYLLLNNCN